MTTTKEVKLKNKEIKKFLIEYEYDGLYRKGECWCKLDNLAPCGKSDIGDCCAGYYTGESVERFNKKDLQT